MKPILFNTDMVRALLEGRKTVTRRAVKPQPENDAPMFCYAGSRDGDIGRWRDKGGKWWTPPCCAGDILWVRETWGNYCYDDESSHSFEFFYRADYPKDAKGYWFEPEHINFCDFPRWRPSIHMPLEAARLFLRVTAVRVERLQEITDADIASEGVPNDWPMNPVYCPVCKGEGFVGTVHPVSLGYMDEECPHCEEASSRYRNLWNSTVKPADLPLYGWAANPWVWVIEFERLSKEEV